MSYERFIGVRHLMASQHRFLNTLTLLAVGGVALSVAAFTTVASVTGGFVDSFEERVLGVNPHLLVTKYGVYFSEHDLVAETIEALDGVESTAPFIIREMLVTSSTSDARPGAMVKGVDADAVLGSPELVEMVVAGTLEDLVYSGEFASDDPDAAPPGAALGKVLAERLDVEVGDVVTLVSPLRGLRSVGIAGADRGADFARVRVAAITDFGYYDYDSRFVLLDYRAVQHLMGLGDVVMGIEVRIDQPAEIDDVRDAVEASLTTGRFKTLDWREINRNLYSSLQLQKLAFTAAMSILTIVAGAVILCVLTMLVLEKRREIAILRSMGATAGGVIRIFVIQGMAIGAVGTLLGVVGGLLACWLVQAVDYPLAYEVYRVRTLPISIHPAEFAAAAAGTLVVCFVATLYPSWRAARVTPVDALRYD